MKEIKVLVSYVKWDTSEVLPDYGDPSDLPEELEVWLDEGYDPDYEPKETIEREYGYPILKLDYEEV